MVGPVLDEPTLLATGSGVDPTYVDFLIAEADFLRYAPRIRLDPVSGARDTRPWLDLKGRATFVDRALDAKTGPIMVRAAFPNPGRILRPGQFATVPPPVLFKRPLTCPPANWTLGPV